MYPENRINRSLLCVRKYTQGREKETALRHDRRAFFLEMVNGKKRRKPDNTGGIGNTYG